MHQNRHERKRVRELTEFETFFPVVSWSSAELSLPCRRRKM